MSASHKEQNCDIKMALTAALERERGCGWGGGGS